MAALLRPPPPALAWPWLVALASCATLAGLDQDYSLGGGEVAVAGSGATPSGIGAGTSAGGSGTAGAGNTGGEAAVGGGGAGGSGGEVSGGATPAGGSSGAGGAGGQPPLSWQVIDTISVPTTSPTGVWSTVTLTSGVTYRLRASGTFIINSAAGWHGDAEYFDFSNPPSSLQDATPGVDQGIGVNDSTVDDNRQPRWGTYEPSHVYLVDWPGGDDAIFVNFHDGNYANNQGALTVEILAWQ